MLLCAFGIVWGLGLVFCCISLIAPARAIGVLYAYYEEVSACALARFGGWVLWCCRLIPLLPWGLSLPRLRTHLLALFKIIVCV